MQKRLITFLWTFCAYIIPSISNAQQTVGLFTKNIGEQDGYVLFSPNSSKENYLIDKCGKLVHTWNAGEFPGLDAYILPNGNLLSTGKIANAYFSSTGSVGGLVQIVDWNSNLIWRQTISDSVTMQNHDIYPMPNGNILVLEWERFTAAQAIAAGRDSAKLNGSPVWSIKVQEITPIGSNSSKIVWEWRLWDHLVQDEYPNKPNYGNVADHPELLNINYVDTSVNQFGSADWTHGNSVTYNKDLDQVMISSRNLSEIYIIDHSTSISEAASHSGGKHSKGGDFLYRWGNPAAYNRGTRANRRSFVQHNASWVPKGYPHAGYISFFNDGTGRPDGDYSSADIFIPPVDANGNYKLDSGKAFGPDTAYWSYKALNPTDFYSSVQGGTQVLPNGNVLICEATKGNFFEVDSNKNIVWRYVNPDGGNGAVAQGDTPKNISCFKANLYLESDSAFRNITLLPGSPVELNPYSYDCYMAYIIHNKPLYTISQIKGYNSISGVADSLNTHCFLKGIVQTSNLGIGNNLEYTLQDSTAAITLISAPFLSGYLPNPGDSIVVKGTVSQANGLTYFKLDSVSELTTTAPIPSVLVSALNENTESGLVTLKGYTLVDTTKWDTTNAGGSFKVAATNNRDTIILNILSSTNLYLNTARPNGYFNVTGIASQNDSLSPYFSGYYLIPRSVQDFTSGAGIEPQGAEKPKIDLFPNPAQNHVNISSTAEITGIVITDMLGQIKFSRNNLHISNKTFDISSFERGMYVFRISYNSSSVVRRMIKE